MTQEEQERMAFKKKTWNRLLNDTVKFIKENIDANKKDEAKILLDLLIDTDGTLKTILLQPLILCF